MAFEILYSVYLWNKNPRGKDMMSPEEPFYDVKGDHQELQSAKVFGCPTYVLDTIIQDEKIIPKWIYCSNMGKFFEHYD